MIKTSKHIMLSMTINYECQNNKNGASFKIRRSRIIIIEPLLR